MLSEATGIVLNEARSLMNNIPIPSPLRKNLRRGRLRAVLSGALVTAIALPMLPVSTASAQTAPAPPSKLPRTLSQNPNEVTGKEITTQQQVAIDRGLAWLARRQTAGNGRFEQGYA